MISRVPSSLQFRPISSQLCQHSHADFHHCLIFLQVHACSAWKSLFFSESTVERNTKLVYTDKQEKSKLSMFLMRLNVKTGRRCSPCLFLCTKWPLSGQTLLIENTNTLTTSNAKILAHCSLELFLTTDV